MSEPTPNNSESIIHDSFFESNLEDVSDESFRDVKDSPKISMSSSKEDIAEILNEDIDLTPKVSVSKTLTKTLPESNFSSKDTKMAFDPVTNIKEDPTNSKQYDALWEQMATDEGTDIKLSVYRLEPQVIKGVKISGYLETFYLPITIPDVVEKVADKYGGGKYSLKVVDANGKYVKAKTFEIAGLPKIPDPQDSEPKVSFNNKLNSTLNRKKEEEEELESDDSDDDGDDLLEDPVRSSWRSPLQPVTPPGGGPPWANGNFGSSGGQFPGGWAPQRNNQDEIERVKKDLESKLDSKFQQISNLLSNINQQSARKDSSGGGLINPELLKAMLPLATTFLERNSSKDNVLASQFDAMNQRMLTLFEGIKDLTRSGDKSKDEILEKERQERQKMEIRFQEMITKLQESTEKRLTKENEIETRLRLEQDRIREESRLREETLREDSRRKEEEFRQKMRQEEEHWRSEMRLREEESRRQQEKWREEARIKDIEIAERMRSIESQKILTEQKLLEQAYSSRVNSKEQQLNVSLEVAKLNSENELKHYQLMSQIELDKIRHATELQMAKIKNEMDGDKRNSDKNSIEEAVAEFMKRRTQLMMIKELNLEDEGVVVESNDSSLKNIFNRVLNKGVDSLGPILEKIIKGDPASAPPLPAQGRVVNPSRPKAQEPQPQQAQQQTSQATPTPQAAPVQEAKPVTPPRPETNSATTPAASVEEDDTQSVETENPQDIMSMLPPMEVLQEEVARVSDLFDYLKEAIDSGEKPEVGASFAFETLSPLITNYLLKQNDSKTLIEELKLLIDMHSPEYVEFFTREPNREWLNTMLNLMREEVAKNPDLLQAKVEEQGGGE